MEVLDDEALNWIETGIYSMIYFLANDNVCRVSNDYLSARIGVSDRTVRRAINKLCDLGYIRREMDTTNTQRTLFVKKLDMKFTGESNRVRGDNLSGGGGTICPQRGDNLSTNNNSYNNKLSTRERDNKGTDSENDDLRAIDRIKNTDYAVRLQDLVSMYAKKGKEKDFIRAMSSAIEEKKSYQANPKNKKRIYQWFAQYIEDDLKFQEYKADKETVKRRMEVI